jgi:hypothetical protein
MPWVEFEHTIPASERAKTIYALDYAATVTGLYIVMDFLKSLLSNGSINI